MISGNLLLLKPSLIKKGLFNGFWGIVTKFAFEEKSRLNCKGIHFKTLQLHIIIRSLQFAHWFPFRFKFASNLDHIWFKCASHSFLICFRLVSNQFKRKFASNLLIRLRTVVLAIILAKTVGRKCFIKKAFLKFLQIRGKHHCRGLFSIMFCRGLFSIMLWAGVSQLSCCGFLLNL